MASYDVLSRSANTVAEKLGRAPIGVVLGSGLSEVLDNLERQKVMDYSQIPGLGEPSTTGHRGALLRVLGGAGDASTHIENRAGEPCANPYLYMASQIAAGLDGIERALDPGDPDPAPYESDKPLMPRSLNESVAALQSSDMYRREFGDAFVDYFLAVKQSEIDRFQAHVTDWEQREYFEVF